MPTIITPAGIESLGCLYNVLTDTYADKDSIGQCVVTGIKDASSTKTIIVDTEQDIGYEIPATVTGTPINEIEVSVVVGASTEEVSNSLSASAGISGSDGAFSASVSADGSYESTKTTKTWYALIYDGKETMHASFEKRDLSGALALDSQFKHDLNDDNYPAEKFLKDYGTHLISGVKIGGQIRFTCSAEYESYATEQSFTVDAKAKYSGACSSASFQGEYGTASSNFDQNIQAQLAISIYGGSTEGQGAIRNINSGSPQTWLDSVTLNPEFIDFADNSLIPVWELCSNPTGSRAQALQAAYECYFGYTLKTEDAQYVSGDDGTNSKSYPPLTKDNIAAYTAGFVHAKQWIANPKINNTLVIVGFGTTIDKNRHAASILVKTLDLKTSEYAYHAVGNGDNNPNSYEQWYEVPHGSVMTGIGLREKNCNMHNMVVYYQALDTSSITGTNGYLENKRQTQWIGDSLDKYEVAQIPAEYNNTRVMTGIFVDCSKKPGGFDRLILQTASLAADPI